MKPHGYILYVLLFMLSTFGRAQTAAVDTLSLRVEELSFENLLDTISAKTGYFFSYNTSILPENELISLDREAVSLSQLLRELLPTYKLEYKMVGDQVILRRTRKSLFRGREKDLGSTLVGRVRQKDSRVYLAGVNVFLDGTTIGTVTGADGDYMLRDVPEGVHQLVFSHIGFLTETNTISVSAGSVDVVNVDMLELPQVLDSVEIISQRFVDPEKWKRHYRVFQREFIGESRNGTETNIVNKEAINFTYDQDSDLLKAYASEPLLVVNGALGYKLSCQLEYFQKERNVTTFHIKARFQEMEPTGRKERRKWRRNREDAYKGSSAHFLKTLVRSNHEREGFQIYRLDENNKAYKVRRKEILCESPGAISWRLCFEGPVYIYYLKEGESAEYLRGFQNTAAERLPKHEAERYQSSILELTKDEVVLYENGQVQKPAHVLKKGYWSWERVADLVPINYGMR